MAEPVLISPTGEFRVVVDPWEARMSLWVECPVIEHVSTGRLIFRFPGHQWSLNGAQWLDASTVRLRLRKYPGSHEPPELAIELDCLASMARIGDLRVDLADLPSAADAALSWPPTQTQGKGLVP